MALLNLFKDKDAAVKAFLREGHVVDENTPPDIIYTDHPGFRVVLLTCKRCRQEYSWDTELRAVLCDAETFEEAFFSGCPGAPEPNLKLV